MILLDVNILLYAHNLHAQEGPKIRSWLETINAQGGWLGLPWVTAWAFLRISTNPRVFPEPWPQEKGLSILDAWMARPNVTIVDPGPRHAALLRQVVTEYQVRGPLVTDAVLAAMALEQGATLASTDKGFRRFERISWINPLEEE